MALSNQNIFRCKSLKILSKEIRKLSMFLTHWNPFVSHMTMEQQQFCQHHNVTELESAKEQNYPNVDTLHKNEGKNLPRGGRVGKLLHCPARKENWIMWPSVKLTSYWNPGLPFSVRGFIFLPLSQAQRAGKTYLVWFTINVPCRK